MAKKEPGLKVPMPEAGRKPMDREAVPFYANGLAGRMTEYRTVQDFGAPQGWPPSAPTSASKTSSVTDGGAKSAEQADMAVATTIRSPLRRNANK